MTEFEEAIDNIGRELGISLQVHNDAVSFDAKVDVEAGEPMRIDLTYLPEGRLLHASADLGEPQQGEAFYRTLMEANHLFSGTGGTTLSLEHDTRHVRLELCCPLVLIRNELFISFLERFLNMAETWRKRVAAPAETVSFEMPRFPFIIMV